MTVHYLKDRRAEAWAAGRRSPAALLFLRQHAVIRGGRA